MSVERVNMYMGEEEDLVIYNGAAILNLTFTFWFEDNTAFTFTGYSSAYFNVYSNRGVGSYLIKSFTSQISRTSNILIMNCSVSDMTFDSNGKFYYEMGYVQSGGYAVPLRFGQLIVR